MSRSLEDALFGAPSPRARAVTRAASVAAAAVPAAAEALAVARRSVDVQRAL